MSMLAFYAVPLISLFLFAAGSVAYLLWAARRRPSRQARWAVIGAGVAVLGYASAVAYGLAFTDPVQVCGQKTLDNDFPLVRVRVDAFPPDVACYWSDSGAHGPSHPTLLGTWVMWAGTGILVVALSVILIGRRSRASRWVRAGGRCNLVAAGGRHDLGDRRRPRDRTLTEFLRGCPVLQGGEESDSCGAGQRWPNCRQGDSASTRNGGEAVRTSREVSTVSRPG
ncbi:hypothetical protein [Streptomyces sp. NPDC097610]|uniref:hypothetical protein n=1 Tax=Streptomyces sp. NPDC097610 TaxID=3157227 RepID=UPI0033186FCB